MSGRSLRLIAVAFGLAGLLGTASGCQWFEKWRGPGFAPGSTDMGGMRGKNPDAKPSGFLYDKRSQEIEKNLGGNF
ncbi:hypothetical protein NA78x_001146 [Anatilimnocola sp. NA78]|uniref:hypothetical protein n=1 Tax=Anatilimnocola sp. NA78 TaxID=3415683 RepID=UPI003CE4B220